MNQDLSKSSHSNPIHSNPILTNPIQSNIGDSKSTFPFYSFQHNSIKSFPFYCVLIQSKTSSIHFNQSNSLQSYMRQFPEPQHFFAAAWQNRDLRSSKEGPRQSLFKQFLTYIQNIGFVAPGFEGFKFQHKCWSP